MMDCNKTLCLIILAMSNVVGTNGLLVHGNSNSSDQTHGHMVDITEIVQKLENLTQQVETDTTTITELESFKQQAVNDRSTLQLLLNQSQELENFRQQAVYDRSTIQSLQNRVFFLEAEMTKLNASKPPSTQEFSTYLMSMNQLIQNVAANEENDRNLTHQLNTAVKQLDELKVEMRNTILNQSNELEHYRQQSESEKSKVFLLQNETQRMDKLLNDLKVQARYTSLSLLDVQTMTEAMNGSMVQLLEERISAVHDHITNVSTRIGFTASVSSTSTSWRSGTLVFPSVITNVGNGYNPSDGVFTAPMVGVYVFFVNVQSYSTQSIYVDIVLNGATKVMTMAYDSSGSEYYEAGPNLAVLSLQTGDRVWVKYHAGQGYYYEGPVTTFSDVSTRIGFTASVSSSSTFWSSGTLVFPSVITNVGNGYNPSDGVFTAPVAGVYVFFVNVQSYGTYTVYVDIVLNGATKVRTMAYGSNDYYEAGPNLAVLSLQKGDRVWVNYHSGQSYYYDGPITTFSGFLI